MRHLIVLPGNSPKNQEWGEATAEHFHAWFDEVTVQHYAHWSAGEEWIDLERELAQLNAIVENAPNDTEFVIFAKSVGSILTFLAVARGIVAPSRCAFFGIPFDMAAAHVFKDDWSPVDSFQIPSVAFHNTHDPTASHDITGKTIEQHCPGVIMFVSTDGNDHVYADFATYEPYLIQLLESRTATD